MFRQTLIQNLLLTSIIFETAEECCNSIIELENNPQLILDIINRPLLTNMPSLDKFYDFLRFSVFKILSS